MLWALIRTVSMILWRNIAYYPQIIPIIPVYLEPCKGKQKERDMDRNVDTIN